MSRAPLLVPAALWAVIGCGGGAAPVVPPGPDGGHVDTVGVSDTVGPLDVDGGDAQVDGADDDGSIDGADGAADTAAPTDTSGSEDAAGGELAAVVARYGLLLTVAGRGEVRDKGRNNWVPAFEGGPATEAELSRPHIAMADEAGFIYIADKDAHAVRRVAPDGTITTVAGTNAPGDDGDAPGPATARRLTSPNGLWVRGDGTLYVLDLGNGKVRRVAVDGTMTTLFAAPGGISTGRGLWVSADESLAYVASGSRVLRWRAGAGVDVFSTGYVSLGNLVVDPEGRLVVTDRGGNRVYRLDAAGERTPIAGNGGATGGGDGHPALDTGLEGVRGVWFLDTGGFLAATHEGSQVWYVDSGGVIHLFLDGRDDHTHAGDGQFFRSPGPKISEARAVTVAPSGDILVTENDYGYVRVVRRRAE